MKNIKDSKIGSTTQLSRHKYVIFTQWKYGTFINAKGSDRKQEISWATNKQCCGSMTFWGGSGSGSANPCLWLMDPDSDPDPDPGSGSKIKE